MVIQITLTAAEVRIINAMINLTDGLPVCADELLDCDMETYNDLSDKFERLEMN